MTTSDQQQLKQRVAAAALDRVREDSVLGIGSGSTVNCFVDALAASGRRIEAAVSASEATTARLRSNGIEVKIIAAASRQFVCIVDASKRVGVLGRFPLPVEVIPMARSYVARQLVALGGQPELRADFVTDNGNVILDVHNLDLVDPVGMERRINNLAGVVTCGLFALRPADVVLMATESGIEVIG